MGPLRGYGGMCRWCGGLPCSLSCVSRGPGDLAILWENLSHCGPRRCISVPTPQYSGASRVGWPCKRGPFRRRLNEAFSPAAQATKLPSELRAPSSGPSIRNRGQLDIDLPAAPGHILVDSAASREICARYGPQTDAFFDTQAFKFISLVLPLWPLACASRTLQTGGGGLLRIFVVRAHSPDSSRSTSGPRYPCLRPGSACRAFAW